MKKNKVGKPLLENIFGENNTIKVLDFLIMGKDFDFTLTQISKGTGISRTAVRKAVAELTFRQVIILSRKDDQSRYFRINKKSDKYTPLTDLYNKVFNEVLIN